LLAIVDSLPSLDKKVFIFSNRGKQFFDSSYHKLLKQKLTQKGYKVNYEYSCRSFPDYYKIIKISGGANKGHPNSKDIEKAKTFALSLKENLKPT